MGIVIGVPKEVKVHEYRVGIIPAGVRELVGRGHKVIVEKNAGAGVYFTDEQYIVAGAEVVNTASEVFSRAELVVKVKEPQPFECAMLSEKQVLFTFLHLAPDPTQADLLIKSGCMAIAYETVTDDRGKLPLLAPMSEVAGRLSIQVGGHALSKGQGGRGVLLSGVPGAPAAKVTVIGGGVVGVNAARVASGMGADVTVFDKNVTRLREIDSIYHGVIKTRFFTKETFEESVAQSELIVGAVLVPGESAPKLLSKSFLSHMKKGAVLVDVAIDQGGCFETSRPTTHKDPTYELNGIIHYCVVNMPGAVALTSTMALSNATMPFVLNLADKGCVQAVKHDLHLARGVNVYKGKIVHEGVAHSLKLPYTALSSCI